MERSVYIWRSNNVIANLVIFTGLHITVIHRDLKYSLTAVILFSI